MITNLFPTVCADDVEATARFYADLFGFEAVFTVDWYVQLEAPGDPGTQLAIVAREHESVPAAHRVRPAGVLIAIEVDDVDAVYARSVAAGHEQLLTLRSEDWGQRHYITVDPAGTMIDVITPIAPTAPEYAAAYTTG
jgi:catechol 2,3-dioxygenase-like lactoylglutathione lyase family enzyme